IRCVGWLMSRISSLNVRTLVDRISRSSSGYSHGAPAETDYTPLLMSRQQYGSTRRFPSFGTRRMPQNDGLLISMSTRQT
ncbi:MAG: hypothetical protein E6417_12230, partial [Bradyrhizobium sp.]|nr:hypothetical protein [Bradyrhizobium sp.]